VSADKGEIAQQTALASNGCMGLPTLAMGRLMLLSFWVGFPARGQYKCVRGRIETLDKVKP